MTLRSCGNGLYSRIYWITTFRESSHSMDAPLLRLQWRTILLSD
jgi:hypothetical protein